MSTPSRDFWDERARNNVGLHAVMTKRWSQDQCLAVLEKTKSIIVNSLMEIGADVTSWLDFGCGTGNLLELPLTIGASAAHVVGIDQSAEMCQLARYKHGWNHQVHVIQATGSALPLSDATFTCVLSVAVLQHQDPATLQRMGSEISRVLKCGGTFITLEGTLNAQREKALAGTTVKTLHSIEGFKEAFGAGLSLVRRTDVTLIDDRYSCLIWKRHQ